jgi:hypothetical protein
MRKSALVVLGVLVAFALAATQSTAAQAVKKVKGHVTFDTDVKVGATVLPKGEYEVSSGNNQLTFRHLVESWSSPGSWDIDVKQKPVVASCTATVLPRKNVGTELDLSDAVQGVRVLRKLILSDTDVAFTITN